MAESELRIEPSDEFGLFIDEIKNDPSIPGSIILAALVQGIKDLAKYDWYESLPNPLYSAYGDSFAYRFHPAYVLTLEREIRDSRDRPERVVLKLKTIQRA